MEKMIRRTRRDETVCDGTNCSISDADRETAMAENLQIGEEVSQSHTLHVMEESELHYIAACTTKRQNPPCGTVIVELP